MNTRQIGRAGEEIAIKYLNNNGISIIEHNFFTKYGEIDLIYKDGKYLVFCEVKYRNSYRYGSSLEAVNYTKQKKIISAARYYLLKNNLSFEIPIRFDVIGIDSGNVKWIKSAF